jgi:hypothetical protein
MAKMQLKLLLSSNEGECKMKTKAYLSVPMREQSGYMNQKIFRETWEDFFHGIIMQFMDAEKVTFTRPIIGTASEYKQTELFKVGRCIAENMADSDVICLPADWESHTNCVADAYMALLYGLPAMAVTKVECEENTDVTDVYVNMANIDVGDYDGPNEIGMISDKFDNYVRLFVEGSLDIPYITQMRGGE